MATNIVLFMAMGLVTVTMYHMYQRACLRYKRKQMQCSEPPQYPHKDPIFGSDLMFRTAKALKSNQWLPELCEIHRQMGHTFSTTKFGTQFIFTIDPENIRSVMTTNAASWGVQPIRLDAMAPFCGRGFLTVDGSLWHQSRRMFSRSFEKGAISDFSALEQFTQKMISELPNDGETVDMQPLIASLFIDATTLFLFGESFGAMSETKTTADVTRAFEQAMLGSGVRIGLGPLKFLAKTKKWMAACHETRSFAEVYVDKALEFRSDLEKTLSKTVLLHSLAQQTTDKEHLRNEVLQAFFVSQGTTSNLVNNILFIVAREPLVWSRLREEVLASIGSKTGPTYDQLQGLTYMRKVINEALRLFAELPSTGRAALKNTVLPTGGGPSGKSPIYIQKGTWINISFYTMQTSKDIWGDDAQEFKPDRWQNSDQESKSYRFLPFGAGPRQCIGRDKALVEASYVLVRLLQKFKRMESRDDRDWQGQVSLSAKNLHGCLVAFHRDV